MSLDQRVRDAGADVRHQIATIDAPRAGVIVRRSRRGRTATGLVAAVGVALAGVGLAAALSDGPESTPLIVSDPESAPVELTPGWHGLRNAEAGIDPGVSLWAIASDGDTAVLAGGVPEDDWQPRVWWSDDGLTWQAADHPDGPATPFAVAIHGDVALLSGTYGPEYEPFDPFLWRSEDGGQSWTEVEAPAGELFMELRRIDGQWVGLGRGSGFGSIWVSEDGRRWELVKEGGEGCARSDQVLSQCVPTGLLDLPGDRLGGYAWDHLWITPDAADWVDPFDPELGDDRSNLASVADGAQLAVAANSANGDPPVVMRSVDEGRTWVVDDSFPGHPAQAYQFGDLQLIIGSHAEDRPAAWIATDDGWAEMPRSAAGPLTGLLYLATEVDGRIVVFGGDDRFLAYQP